MDIETLNGLVKRQAKLKLELDELKRLTSEKQAEYDQVRNQELPDALSNADIKNYTVNGIGQVRLYGKLRVNVKKSNEGLLWDWLRENGYGGLIKESVHSSTLTAFVDEFLKKGEEELPEEIFNVYPYSQARIYPAK